MVPSLVVYSVNHKIKERLSVIIGNYEFYYAAGLISPKLKIDANGFTQPKALDAAIKERLKKYVPDSSRTDFLCNLLKKYEVKSENYDEDMKELFRLGSESNILNEKDE